MVIKTRGPQGGSIPIQYSRNLLASLRVKNRGARTYRQANIISSGTASAKQPPSELLRFWVEAPSGIDHSELCERITRSQAYPVTAASADGRGPATVWRSIR